MAECSTQTLRFQSHGTRSVEAAFDGGRITSDAGALALRELEHRLGIIAAFVGSFTDHRDPDLAEFSVQELLTQRIMGLALGYEDLVDHDQLRHDPLLALACGRRDVTGQDRRDPRDRGKPLAGKSTLNRLELTPPGADAGSRYQKIVASIARLHETLVDVFLSLQARQGTPTELVLDFDATDDPVHGDQLGKFFHGYYGHDCYLPLYAFCGDWPLLALLRPADQDASAGTVPHLARIVARLRAAWPEVRIIVRGDSGFCRESILKWCETNSVKYLVGLAKNSRLTAEIATELATAKAQFESTGAAARVFKDFAYQTRESWSCERRVVGKAEHLAKGPNPRFVVTNLSTEEVDARTLYEDKYCARGEMENRIKEQQRQLFADRLSCEDLRANQIRLLFSTIAYTLCTALRTFGLEGTELAQAEAGTIRQKLLKLGGRITVSCRRIVLSLSEAYPYQSLFAQVLARVRALPPLPSAALPSPRPTPVLSLPPP